MTYALYFGATDSEARERATPDFVIADFDGAFVGTQIYAEAGPIPPLAFELDPPRRLARLDDYWRALEDHAFASAPAPGPPEPARFLNDAGAEWLRYGSWEYPERLRDALQAHAALGEQLHRARQRWASADVPRGGF